MIPLLKCIALFYEGLGEDLDKYKNCRVETIHSAQGDGVECLVALHLNVCMSREK